MGAALPFMAVASAGLQAFGAVREGIATSQAANYKAQVARNNAIYASAAGTSKAMNESLKGAAAGGRIKAAQAANGVDVNTGSNVNVQRGQRMASNVNAVNTENNALLQAYGYQAEASLDESTAKNAETSGYLKATGGLLGNAPSISGAVGKMLQSSGGGSSEGQSSGEEWDYT